MSVISKCNLSDLHEVGQFVERGALVNAHLVLASASQHTSRCCAAQARVALSEEMYP